MTGHTSDHPELGSLPPATLHVLECADSRLRHSTGIRALGTLKALAPLAPSRQGKPGFREKLDSARRSIPVALEECEAFFRTRLPGGRVVGQVFPSVHEKVVAGLRSLENLPLERVPATVDEILGALRGITDAISRARQSVKAFLRETTQRLAGLCESSGVRLVTADSCPEDMNLFLDTQRLGDALSELTTNALRYAFPEGAGTIRLELAEGNQPNTVAIAVADDGCGIPEEVREGLFERGTSTGGSGEGLALVKEVVEDEHLGTLTYTTGTGGTRWQITLPVRIPRERLGELSGEEGPSAAATLPESRPHRGRRALPATLVVVLLAVVAVAAAILLPDLLRPEGEDQPISETGGSQAVPSSSGSVDSSAAESTRGAKESPPAIQYDYPAGLMREIVHEATGIPMVLVPAGEFTMGADDGPADESPARRVTITKPFYMGKFEVTQAQYERVMGENPSRFKGEDLPVDSVSFLECVMFCAETGLRLPTEAEWEYAAQTSVPPPSSAGDQTHPVETGQANALGLHGMLGNVAEWCADWYGLYTQGDAEDPTGPGRGSRRVVRGGSFLTGRGQLRHTLRSSLDPAGRSDTIGFRVVIDVEPAQSEP